MDDDGVCLQGRERVEGATEHEPESQAAQEPLIIGSVDAAGEGMDYEALLAKRDAKIAELEGAIAEAAEKLRAEMDELRR